ncbi:MAG: dihydroneopterin aldolase [bacterium]
MIIRLHAISFFAHHGVFAEEKTNGNNFEMDIEAELDSPRGVETDQLSDTLDYSELQRIALQVSSKKRYDLIEALASDICAEIIRQLTQLDWVMVRIRKLQPPLMGQIKSVEVEIRRTRHDG